MANGKKQLLTNSSAGKAACPRAYHIAYNLGYRRDTDHVNLRFGTAVHLALELHAKGATAETASLAAITAFDKSAGTYEIDLYERAKIWVLLTEYFAYWPMLDHVATEMQFCIPLVNPETGRASRTWELAGVLDGIIRIQQPDGRLAVLEHKTSAFDVQKPDCDYWKQLRMDSQISIYWNAAKALGYEVETVIYNVIRKPKQTAKQIPLLDDAGLKIVLDAEGSRALKTDGKPYQAGNKEKGLTLQTRIETPDEYSVRIREIVHADPSQYFVRQEIPRLQSDLDEAAADLWMTALTLNFANAKDCFPKRSNQCVGFGTCAYFDLCTGDFDPKAGIVPDGFIKLDNVHPELSLQGATDHG